MPRGNTSYTPKPGDGPAAEFLDRLAPKEGVGRPTKYDPIYCEEVVNVMRAGFSLTAFAGIILVTTATIHNWRQEHPEFDEACKIGKSARLVHWEESAVKTARGGGGPGAATMINFALRNLSTDEYPDKQRVENTGADGKPIEHNVTMVRRKIIRPGDAPEETTDE